MRLIKDFNKLSIKIKMIISFLSVSIMSVLLAGIFSHHYYSQAVKEDFYNISNEATSRLNYFLEYYFKGFQRSSSSLIESDTIQQWLLDDEYSNEDILSVESELHRYVAMNFPEINAMFLVSRNHHLISTRGTFSNDYTMEEWYGEPLQRYRTILPTHISNYDGSGKQVLSIILPVFNKNTMELIGNLIIDISLAEINNAFTRSNLGQSGLFFIVSNNDIVVYHPNRNWNGRLTAETDLQKLNLTPDSQETSLQKLHGTEYLIASTTSTITNWNIVSMVPFEEMAKGLRNATTSNIIVLSIISLIIVLTVPILSIRFVSPIVMLKNLMRQVAGGDFTVRSASVPGQDEFQQLNHGFNVMVGRLDELFTTNMDLRLREVQSQLKQNEAIIKALQNQINPHLLYNSLAIIKGMAYLEGVPKIEKMAGNLADIYRYTARFNGVVTTLGEEIVHLRKYLDIVHLRYPKHFQSHIHVNEKFLSCHVVKLIVQPILENAVKYAIEPMEGQGAIIVSAYNEEDDLIIEIADNGPGIEAEKLEEVNKELEKISNNDIQNTSQRDSLGIVNVHTRLFLKYGKGYGVRIDSFPGRGTVVSLRIPLQGEQITS